MSSEFYQIILPLRRKHFSFLHARVIKQISFRFTVDNIYKQNDIDNTIHRPRGLLIYVHSIS